MEGTQQQQIEQLTKDVGDIGTLIKQLAADRAKGGTAALAKDIPQVMAEGQKVFADVKAALPTIKAGYKTTEFWLVAGAGLVIVGADLAGHPLSVTTDSLLGALTGVYAVVRGFTKAGAAASAPAAGN